MLRPHCGTEIDFLCHLWSREVSDSSVNNWIYHDMVIIGIYILVWSTCFLLDTSWNVQIFPFLVAGKVLTIIVL